MAKRGSEQLREAMKLKPFVRFTRPFDDGYTRGYVLDVGKDFFTMLITDETCRFNGFQCLRIKDVRKFRQDPYAHFYVAALEARKQYITRKPRIKLGSVAEILLSVQKESSLVTIYRETVKPDTCWIGKITKMTEREVSMLEIGPDAEWRDKPTTFKLKEITEIDFGGGYEEALSLVGGAAPKLKAKA
jgi:hypothetical protein